MDIKTVIIYFIGFLMVAIAANQIAKIFQKIKFPLITGFIITGIVAGSSFLNFITPDAVNKLNFLNEIALSIIAFSAGAELYLDDLRSRLKSIKWMTIGQLIITFVLSSVSIFYIADNIPFMANMNVASKIAVAILFGTIFVARSPSSAIAVINEMRANGPFTKTVMGVTVVKDVLVIILFAISFSIAKALINGEQMGVSFLIILFLELIASFTLGYLVGKFLEVPFLFNVNIKIKGIAILFIGYGIYLLSHYIKVNSPIWFDHVVILEPLLIAIIGGFVLTNYSKHRIEFKEILQEISPTIYIIFFTLIGASLSFQTLMNVFGIAFALFLLRLVTMFLGGVFGVTVVGDPKKYTFIAWMPYLTQAGVALGLATIISEEFPVWGHEFETIVIAIIILNQLVGPPLFKWTLNYVKESHLRANMSPLQSTRDAVIFGIENQSIALAKQLETNNWKSRLVSLESYKPNGPNDIEIITNFNPTIQNFKDLELDKTEAIVLMLTDEKNFKLAELIYEHIGIKDVIVRLNNRENFEKFHKLGALIIEPATAMVSLLDHFVRSPNAASLLLGMDEGQDTMDIEIKNKDIHGLRIRELRLPTDLIILSIKRSGQMLITHGYTRLRIGDEITLVGSKKSLEDIKFKLDT
ncbi:MAG: cation:proton antiporter [Flavobacteriaceae bacterium]|nr:cation:proton antiporter [Flavobacteriaceae bacterium]